MKKLDWAKYGTAEAPEDPRAGITPGSQYRSENLNWLLSHYDRLWLNELKSSLENWQILTLNTSSCQQALKLSDNQYLLYEIGATGFPLSAVRIVDPYSGAMESYSLFAEYGHFFFVGEQLYFGDGGGNVATRGPAFLSKINSSFEFEDEVSIIEDEEDVTHEALWVRHFGASKSFYACIRTETSEPTVVYTLQHSYDGITWTELDSDPDEFWLPLEGQPIDGEVVFGKAPLGLNGDVYIGPRKLRSYSLPSPSVVPASAVSIRYFRGSYYLEQANGMVWRMFSEDWGVQSTFENETSPQETWLGPTLYQNDRLLIKVGSSSVYPGGTVNAMQVGYDFDSSGRLLQFEIPIPYYDNPNIKENWQFALAEDRVFFITDTNTLAVSRILP